MAEVTPCTKKKFDGIKTILLAMEATAKRLLIAGINKLGAILDAFIQAELALLTPVVAMAKIVLESFVIFPLTAVLAVVSAIESTMLQPLLNLGLNAGCHDTAKFVAFIKKLLSYLDGAKRWLTTKRDAAQNHIDELDAFISSASSAAPITALLKTLEA